MENRFSITDLFSIHHAMDFGADTVLVKGERHKIINTPKGRMVLIKGYAFFQRKDSGVPKTSISYCGNRIAARIVGDRSELLETLPTLEEEEKINGMAFRRR